MTKATTIGLYEIPETARYLSVTSHLPQNYPRPTPRHLSYWLRKGIASEHLTSLFGRHAVIDFEDLVSMRVIYLLFGMGVSVNKIQKAKLYLEKITGHSHPFATERLWTETIDIFTEIGSLLITASKSGQLPFMELVRQNLVNVHDMTFNQGVADSWSPKTGILIKPNIQFGVPCIANTGIPASSIWKMYLGGDSIDFLAKSYNIPEYMVKQAITWEENLATVTFTRTTKASTLLGG